MLNADVFESWFYDSFGYDEYELIKPPFTTQRWIPEPWINIIQNGEEMAARVGELWAQNRFKSTSELMMEKLVRVEPIIERSSGKYLIAYFFHANGGLYGFGAGVSEDLTGASLPVEVLDVIQPLYTLHSRFVDLSDRQSGWMASQALCEDLQNQSVNGSSLLKVFYIGTNAAAIEYADGKVANQLLIWASDEEIEEVDNLIEEIDEWLAEQLAEFDDAKLLDTASLV